tara:strand:- start:914 stop:1369 length:456 start_codon:yes stop_codon:yes gene_type:complete
MIKKSSLNIDCLCIIDGKYCNAVDKKIYSGFVEGHTIGLLKDGLQEEEWRSFHKNGKIFWKGSFTKGKKQSTFYTFYDNGKLLKFIKYKEDLPEGEWKTYWKNGNLWIRGFYELGLEIGIWEYYNRDGTLRKKEDKSSPKENNISLNPTFH